jgi:Short C-terminal domain
MIVADVSFSDIFWSILWFYFLFLWIMVLFHILGDLFRDHTLSAVTKTLWVLFLVFRRSWPRWSTCSPVGREWPSGPRPASSRPKSSSRAMFDRSPPPADATATPADQIARAKELLDAGTIDQAEFDRLKAKALA